jgi:cell division septum initiation protein DivIVA
MAKSDIQQQIDGLQHHIDSLLDNNNLLKHQVDSLQQSINSTRDSLQNMLQQNPSDTVSSI